MACGPGVWTQQLLRHADSVTAVDASPEMLAIAASRVGDDRRVRFVEADLFSWRPDASYDAVFFGFWLSHVPLERFEAFWSTAGSGSCRTPAYDGTMAARRTIAHLDMDGSARARLSAESAGASVPGICSPGRIRACI